MTRKNSKLIHAECLEKKRMAERRRKEKHLNNHVKLMDLRRKERERNTYWIALYLSIAVPNNYNDSKLDDRLLNNNLLFGTIHKNKTPEHKIKKIKKYLDRGADVNATDANYKNNTPLHVAVMKEEPEVVSFLLEQGAQINIKNSDHLTDLDIVCQFGKNTCISKDIVTMLKTFNDDKVNQPSTQQDIDTDLTRKSPSKSANIWQDPKNSGSLVTYNVVKKGTSVNNRKIVRIKSRQQQPHDKIFHYKKRTGTSGLSGQLYETKLLSLILFRALYVHEVKTFSLATNVESMGAFDDIIFRFHSNKDDKPIIMFVQAKHRDNPSKDTFTVEEIMKLNGDFSLYKYLDSYINISQMFVPENCDNMFKGEFKNMDCEFIIYTSAYEKFSKMKTVEQTECKRFINTSTGKVFQFDYDDQDVECLVQTIAKSRAELLAKRLSKFFFKDNHSNMMMDDLIKTYHVFLAQHILRVEFKDGDLQNNFRNVKFRESLFTSSDNLILAFKATICQEKNKLISLKEQKEVENILMSSSFKVPLDFGNLNFCFSGSEQKKEKKLQYLCLKFKKLFENANVSANIVMKVDDSMVGPNEILQSTDLESYRLGGLVGNLLVLDEETKTLKFNFDVHSLSDDNLKLLKRLKSDVFKGIDLSKCRFDINVHRFPRLSLVHEEYNKSLIEKFLSKLTFYTNQATEDEVENILKQEIDKHFVNKIPRRSDALFNDAIFLKVHDCVQKWWKQQNNAPYLTEACKFFCEAKKVVLNSSLLSVLHFTYTETIKNALPEIKFKDTALELLHLDGFYKGSARMLCVTTENNVLTVIKLIQYFEKENLSDYYFIDLDYVVFRNYFVNTKLEIKESKTNTLIVVGNYSKDLISKIYSLVKHFKGKVIVICNRNLVHQIKTPSENIVEIVDSQIGLTDLADTMRTILLEERYIMFQGKDVPLSILFKDESYHLLNSNLLCMIINNEKIKIGNFLNNPAYDEILNSYINEQVCRYITLDPNVQASGEFNVLKYNELDDNFTPDTRDIILITDKYEEFAEFINTYENCIVHWFRYNGEECLVWHESRGNLMNLFKHIHRGAHDEYALQPVTLEDVKEKVVIISGEPGMGKSSLLTHLAIGTKHKYPTLWISKINLLEYTNEFRRMKETKVSIDFKEAVKFLFRVIEFEAKLDIIIDQVSVIGDNISFNKNEVELNFTGPNLFEIELFIHCYNNDRVVLLFDGFDEICPDFAYEFMQLVNILKKSKVLHLWVTSRFYNVLHQLENTLETFSFRILPLGWADQVEFLEKIWSKKFSSTKQGGQLVEKKITKDFVLIFLWNLNKALGDRYGKFLSIPLHLYMISEIFQDSVHKLNPNMARNVNLNQLYELFVDVKFSKIRFGEKKPLLCVNDPDVRKLIHNERTGFLYIHKIIAAHVIFGQSDEIQLFDDHDITAIHDFIERIKVGEEKTGIIEQIIQNEPKFVHYTFAEYFAAEFLYDRLKSFHCKTSLWMYFINTFLLCEEGGGPRRFFNAKLGNHPLMFNEINADLNEMFETLLLERNKLAEVLTISIDFHLENIAIFLLKCVKTVLSKKYLNDLINVVTKCPKLNDPKECILCLAVRKRQKSFVTFVIELIKDLDLNRLFDLFYSSDYPVLQGSYSEDWLNMLLPNLSPPLIVELFCMQYSSTRNEKILNKSFSFIHELAHVLGKNDFKCIDEALEKLNNEQLMTIFSTKDYKKRLPAHTAAFKQAFEFFDKLESLLERNQFIKICMALDGSGRTPLHYFRYTKKDCDKLQILLNKVNEENTDVKLTLNYFIDKAKLLNEYDRSPI